MNTHTVRHCCPECAGSGEMRSYVCPFCDGVGTIDHASWQVWNDVQLEQEQQRFETEMRQSRAMLNNIFWKE